MDKYDLIFNDVIKTIEPINKLSKEEIEEITYNILLREYIINEDYQSAEEFIMFLKNKKVEQEK